MTSVPRMCRLSLSRASVRRPGNSRGARRRLRLCWPLLAALFGTTVFAADYPLEIIDLRSRLPEDVVPIIAPLAGADGSVAGSGGTLFVRASPERLADIRRALAEIDRPAEGLLIQVRQAGSRHRSAAGIDGRIDERIVDDDGSARVRIGGPGPRGSSVAVWAGEQGRQSDILQQVRALDGHPARISIATEHPLPYREAVRGPGNRATREGVLYDRSETGFSVLPRVLGDRVTLEIGTIVSEPAARGVTRGAGLATRVEGRLGEWIPIGSSTERTTSTGAGLLHAGQGTDIDDLQVELRVLRAR